MQAHINGVKINDVPEKLCPEDNKNNQKIIFGNDEVKLPISFYEPIPYIPIIFSSDMDLKEFQWLSLTSSDEWIPYPKLDIKSDDCWTCGMD